MQFALIGTGLYTPHFASVAAWRDNTPSDEATAPSGALIDRRNRRLSSALMRALADVYGELLTQSQVDPLSVASVFGSALGEAQTMIGLLDQMWARNEEPSPMAFAASVHNAAAGVVSISTKNTGFTTSLAADFDTVAMSIAEAIGLLATGACEALIVCGDESAPEKLVEDIHQWGFLCAGIALSSQLDHPQAIARIGFPTMSEPTVAASTQLDSRTAANPQAGLVDLIDAVREKRWGTVRLDRGKGRGWTVEVSAP